MPKHYNIEGHSHYLTFSCYKGYWLFRNESLCRLFISNLAESRDSLEFMLWAFVIMPNHVHLLLKPKTGDEIAHINHTIKRKFSFRARQLVDSELPDLKDKLTSQRGSRILWRFWQQGGGYDRNITKLETLRKTIDYIHNNPVRKRMVREPCGWEWSSARFWLLGSDEPLRMDIPEVL